MTDASFSPPPCTGEGHFFFSSWSTVFLRKVFLFKPPLQTFPAFLAIFDPLPCGRCCARPQDWIFPFATPLRLFLNVPHILWTLSLLIFLDGFQLRLKQPVVRPDGLFFSTNFFLGSFFPSTFFTPVTLLTDGGIQRRRSCRPPSSHIAFSPHPVPANLHFFRRPGFGLG